MGCPCRLCERHRRIQSVKSRGIAAEMSALIDELEDALDHTEDDLNHKNAILDGSWPTAAEYANRILQKVKERESADSAIPA
jgi:hypothetical protein